MMRTPKALIALAVAAVLAAPAHAADEAAPLEGFTWEFNGDAIVAGFFNSSAYFGQDAAFLGDEIGQWYEFGLEPKLAFRMPSGKGEMFGEVSAIGTFTSGDDASGLTIGLQDPAAFTLEQAHLGWRMADPFDALEGESFEAIVGNMDYRIGSGMLMLDGGGDGAERGGWYLGMRKAFHKGLLLRVKNDDLLLEGFSLANHPRQGGIEGRVNGLNAEVAFAGDMRVGGTLMGVDPNLPATDTFSVLSGRFDLAPEHGFGVSAEYALEDADGFSADGGFLQLSYTPESMAWSPMFSYRYATFSGDDPGTADDEGFRTVAYGYTDYGSWYQGEISGNYPLGNGNLASHLLRMKVQPSDAVTLNVLYYQFTFNEPAAFGLTSDDWGDEFNLAVDWAYSDSIYLIGVLAYLAPGAAAVQMTGGNDDWVYAMLYASYAW